MRIVFVADGNSIHSYRWVSYFASSRWEVHWISRVPMTFPPIEGVEFYETPDLRPWALGVANAARQVCGIVRRVQPHVLHAHYVGANGLVAAATGFHPFVATAWGSDVLMAGRARTKRAFVKNTLRRADLVTCDAEHMAQAMVELGVDRSKIHIVYFGMDTDRFCPERRDPALRRALGIDGAPAIISLRQLEPLYDVESLVRATPAIIRRIPTAKVLVVGGGSQDQMLKDLAVSLHVADSVRFIGKIANTELPRYLASMDVYVSTALSDGGIASSTAEAMACGLAVVVTDFGENGKWVVDGVGGFLVPLRSPGAIAEKVVTLLENPQQRGAAGLINREIIEKRNSYTTEMGKMQDLYVGLTSRAARSSPSAAV